MLLGPRAHSDRVEFSLSIVRIALAILLFIHGAFRASHWDPYVTGFGEWLGSIGFPCGFYWAAAVTLYEVIAPWFLLARRFVTLACLGHIVIVGLGIDVQGDLLAHSLQVSRGVGFEPDFNEIAQNIAASEQRSAKSDAWLSGSLDRMADRHIVDELVLESESYSNSVVVGEEKRHQQS